MKPSMSAKRMLGKKEKKIYESVTKFVADICVSSGVEVQGWGGM